MIIQATAFRRLRGAAVALLLGASCTSTSTPIRIGLAGPLTDAVGAPLRRAVEMAVEEINAEGGVRGRRLELVARDDKGSADAAVAVASELYASDVVAVIGHVSSTLTLAAAPIYNGGSTPVVAISPSSSSPEVTAAGAWTFRVCPSDEGHGAALARWAYDGLKLRRAAVLYYNDDYGRGIREAFERRFVQLGGIVVESDPYLGDAPDFGPYLDRIQRDGVAQFLMLAGSDPSQGAELLRQIAPRHLALPLLGADGLEGLERSGPMAEGTYLSAAYLPVAPGAANRRFVDAYQKRFPNAGLPNQPAAAGYDAVYLVRQALLSGRATRAGVRAALEDIGHGQPAYQGVTGSISFDAQGDLLNADIQISVLRGGSAQLAEVRR